MAFRQQHRPQSSRQISYHAPESAVEAATTSPQLKRPLEQSEEWVLFSPVAPSTTARTHTTSTERTPRTAGLSRFSEFGSLDTAAPSEQEDDAGTFLDTDDGEELDSLDDGLHAFHEPSEYAAPVSRVQQSGDTVLPTHDGLGEFQPDANLQEHMWQFERPRRRAARRRSSVQRHFTILDGTDHVVPEQDRRQRIEQWRLEQSKALLEEIEKETRRRRRMSMVSAVRSRVDSTQQDTNGTTSQVAQSVSDVHSESSDEGTEHLSLWQRITRRVIRDLIGLDEDTLSVIFGEALPEQAMTPKLGSPAEYSTDTALQEAGVDASTLSDDSWQTKLLERVAQELGILVHQLSEHPGAFSTYQHTQSTPDYAGLTSTKLNPTLSTDLASSRQTSSQPSAPSPASAQFAPTFPATPHEYSEASLWGIEEELDEVDPLNSFRPAPAAAANIAEDLEREREYWERELDVKMIFNFLMKRFSTRRPSISSPQPRKVSSAPSAIATDEGVNSARRAAIIRQHHPLVDRTTDRGLPTSSAVNVREGKRKDAPYRTYFTPQNMNVMRHQKLRSTSSCASQSTKKSKRSGGSGRNYWDLGGSVGSGSVFAGEV
ncbi:uncharacterized protein K460DRAFT_371481 [Cucurbitaria berberidis CBS 394.84]|uniref:Uncharacterized protein n=1 Tax=Cucurbitaria berberidis CBS 394.84 TaxID=1168544 RepID=A0A9P4G774_9PLEO|nr:uncharacterized protein K460DRAFT_371481 [Cucurbitaria berberidis CBS 394.84]KAF1840269.1 hypothetical protein K460DRAFT_371481 [Cucurbitaria berberidis CBS 394.84]